MRRLTTVFLFLLFSSSIAFGQLTTEGRDFWFGFLQNNDTQSPVSLEVFITSNEVANGTIEIFTDGTSVDFTINPGETFSRVIGNVPNNPYSASGSGVIQRRAIHITSDVNITVYAFNNRTFSADAAVILPTNSLGKKYYASTYFEQAPAGDAWGSDNSPAELLVVASQNNTRLNIVPTVATEDGKPAGQPFEITLNQGDIYQLRALADLTGTLIESVSDTDDCKNFAVFGGNRWTRVTGDDNCAAVNGGTQNLPGGFAGDQLYEQMYPVTTWGRQYSAIPYRGRTGYLLQITAAEDNTTVNVTGQGTINLNEGEFERITMTDRAAFISSDKPIQVAQLSQSLSCDFPAGTVNPNGPGDPFMVMLSPNEQFLRRITFNALVAQGITDYFVTVIVNTADIDKITLEGNTISPSSFATTPGDASFSYATISIIKGQDYTLDSESGFIAYIYGFGQVESFGYVAGASLENLNVQITGEDPFILDNVISKEGCINAPIAFSAEFDVEPGQDPRYNTFDWDFGDGSTGTGQDTVHIYDTPGEYEIVLIASDGNNVCGGNSEIIRGTVTIVDVVVDEEGIVGAASVCPDVEGVVYSISGEDDNTYEWEVGGGLIVGASDGEQITVNWGPASDDAYVKVLPKNRLGCPGEEITLPVKINKRLEPLLPRGNSEVCFTDFSSVSYSTPITAGSEYEWFIEGGNFTSGNDTNEVTVAWDGVGTGRIWYREFNPVISDCEGFSPVLDVVIYEEMISVETVSNVLCNGEASGSISLALNGGKPGGTYTVNWDNGMTGAEINGLTAGTYEATIRDAIGCVLEVSYVVTEPAILEIAGSNVEDVRCFEESNGIISVDVTGGTGDYSYSWSGNGVNTTTVDPMLTGLPTGNYSVIVRDENGCEATTDFFVDEPPLLEPDLETLINQPICPDASNGTAYLEAKGGTPDYQFFWSNDPTTDEQEGMNFSRGTYTVRIVDANGCETSLDIEVTERFPKFFLPNAFSPNGDGQNDVFRPVTDCNLNYSIQVFNEWGAVTYASNDIFEGWDGTMEGEPVPNGKYSYVIFYSGSLNGVSFEETLRGTLRLYR